MQNKAPHLYRLGTDERGVTVIEFALISPVFLFMLMGTFDIGYAVYMRSTLNGAIQLAARDSSLQDATDDVARAEIDARVREVIQSINRDATVNIERKNYAEYADVESMEEYDDDNGNGTCDANEAFEDINSNGEWDNVGRDGIGGARDSVLYSIEVSYDTLFPFSNYQRSAGGKKIVGYETRTRNKYVTNSGGARTIKLPVYETTKVARSGADDGMIRVPIYKNQVTGTNTKKLPKYKNVTVPLPGARSGTMQVPVYALTQTGTKTHKIPITELVEVPRAGNPTGEVKMPIYEFVVETRDTSKSVVDYEEVSVPVYVNVITQTDKGPKLRRVFVRNETIRRPKLETKRKVSTGTREYIQRRLVGYQTVSKPTVVLARKNVGYKTLTIPTYSRKQVGTKTVKRPTQTIKRILVGYETKVTQKTDRVLVGYQDVKVPTETLQRRLVGYKTIVKQSPPTKVLAGTEVYKVPVYEDSNASFNIAGVTNNRTMTAQTILKNQPYGDQAARATTPGNCT